MVLLMDEMYIREDLVYDKFSGWYIYMHTILMMVAFLRFPDWVCSINNHLLKFEHQLQQGSEAIEQPLAKTMLVLMVRGLFSGLQFPYVQFPCCTLRSHQIFHIV